MCLLCACWLYACQLCTFNLLCACWLYACQLCTFVVCMLVACTFVVCMLVVCMLVVRILVVCMLCNDFISQLYLFSEPGIPYSCSVYFVTPLNSTIEDSEELTFFTRELGEIPLPCKTPFTAPCDACDIVCTSTYHYTLYMYILSHTVHVHTIMHCTCT